MKRLTFSMFLVLLALLFFAVQASDAQTKPGGWVEPPPAAPLPLPEALPEKPQQPAKEPQKKQPAQKQQQQTKRSLPAPSQEGLKELKQYTEKLRKDPADQALRERIIAHARSMQPAPAMPEEAERHIARGTALLKKANDKAGYQRAIAEFNEAIVIAPWSAAAYYHLGEAQDKAGLHAEAISSLNLYLLAAPDAKNARNVKNRISALEVEVERAVKQTRANAERPAAAAPLMTEGRTDLPVVKISDKNKTLLSGFEGAWHYEQKMGSESIAIPAFTVGKNPGGDLVAVPPDRGTESEAAIPGFEITGQTLKLTILWKMKAAADQWKNEEYELTLSPDNKTLSGSYSLKTSKGKNAYLDMVLFRK